MKICHLTSVHNYDDIRISIKECQSLVNANYNVHLISPNTTETCFKGIKIHGVQNVYKGRMQRIFMFSKVILLKAIEIDADIYHFHDPELIPVGLKLERKGKKVIYDVHEDVPRQIMTKHWIPKLFRKLISILFEIYEKKSAKKFTAIVTSTPFIRERFLRVNKKTVDIKNYPLIAELFQPNIVYEEKEAAITYIGGISTKRGLFTMVQAVNRLGDVTLKLAGNISDNEELKKVQTMDGWSKVDYLGFVNREGIKSILKESKAGLVVLQPEANYIDSLPIKMFEYMAAGIPVIASNFPLWKEIIIKNKCGICINPLNVNELVNAIQWLLDNPYEAKKMGENGRKAVEENFNWEHESKRLLELYQNI